MINVQRLSQSDFNQVKDIIEKVTSEWGEGWNNLALRMFINDKSAPFDINKYVAKDNDNVVGILAIKKEICASVIYFLATKRGYRGKGIGTLLLNYAEEVAKKSKCSFLRVDVYDEYERNKNFYIKNGFSESGTIKNYYEIGDSQAFFFKKIQ